MSLQATLATRAVERRSLSKRQRVVCASSAKGATMRIVATEFGAVVGIFGKYTRGIAATDCDFHTIENVNVISGDDLCARSTQRHIGDEVDRAVTSR